MLWSLGYPSGNPKNNWIGRFGAQQKIWSISRWRNIHTRVAILSICSEYTMPNTQLDKLFAV